MSRRIITAVVCILCVLTAFSLSSCKKGDAQQSTEDGVLIKITSDNGDIIGYERRYHNDHGDMSRLDVYDKDEVYDHYIVYEYDDDYRIIKETTYKADGIGDHYYEYTYDDDGNLKEKGYFTMSDGAERTLYNPDGSAKERYAYDANDTLILHEVCENGIWKSAPLEEPTDSTEAEAAQATE